VRGDREPDHQPAHVVERGEPVGDIEVVLLERRGLVAGDENAEVLGVRIAVAAHHAQRARELRDAYPAQLPVVLKEGTVAAVEVDQRAAHARVLAGDERGPGAQQQIVRSLQHREQLGATVIERRSAGAQHEQQRREADQARASSTFRRAGATTLRFCDRLLAGPSPVEGTPV
jgi:hypothetical protein